LAERLATTKVTESDFSEESEGGSDFLVTLAGAGGEVIARSEMKQGLGRSHFEEFMNRFIEVAGEKDVGLKALTFASGACDENVREKLHGNLFVAHAAATFATTCACVEGKGGGGEACALGFFSGGVEFADQIVDVEVEEGGGAWGLGERGLID
jgi:hypothetical protein